MSDRVGQQLGNYHIHLGTQAAIKILHTQLTGDDMDKFRIEARTIAHLIHPHIVRVLEFGVEGRTPFLVMDYAPNGTLRQHHPKGTRLPVNTIVSYVKQVTDALQYAHDEKLIHRDIKPENMLLGRRNEILLTDFGIATVAQSSRYQSTQDMAGTMAYMAPEQIQGKPRPASDQYALGVVVYEWISGDRPFHGSLTELVGQHLSVPPPSLQEKVPTIPPSIEQVVLTALAKDPKERFSTVQAFAIALEKASRGEGLSLPSSTIEATASMSPAPSLDPSFGAITMLHSGANSPANSTSIFANDLHETTVGSGASSSSFLENVKFVQQYTSSAMASSQSISDRTTHSAKNTEEENTMLGHPTPNVDIAIMQVTKGPHRRNSLPRWNFNTLVLFTLLLLVLGGLAYATPSVFVPLAKNIFGASHQVRLRTLSATTPSQTQVAQATGSKTSQATHASGDLRIANFDLSSSLTLQAGLIIPNDLSLNIQMMLDETVTVRAAYGLSNPGVTFVPAHVVQIGPIGNIPGDRTGFYHCFGAAGCQHTSGNGWDIWNVLPFSGGQDAQTYSIIQQSDIDGAANALIRAYSPDPRQMIQTQLHANEHFVGTPRCEPHVASDHLAGDKATSVTITVTFVCTGEVSD